jgi:hypothetical protein
MFVFSPAAQSFVASTRRANWQGFCDTVHGFLSMMMMPAECRASCLHFLKYKRV